MYYAELFILKHRTGMYHMPPKIHKLLFIFFIKGITFFIILTFAVILLDYLEPDIATLSDFMDMYIREFGFFGMFVFMLLCAVLSSFFVPRQVLSAVGGYAYGPLLGTIIVTLGVSFGCFMTFLYARFLLQEFVQKKLAQRIYWLEHLFSKNPFGMSMSLRFIPIGSNVFLNMFVGVTKVPVLSFTLGSAIGYIPQNLVAALLGSGLRADPWVRTSLAVLLYVFGVLAGIWFFRKYRPDDNINFKTLLKSIFKGK